jgi:hypothetical protein
MTDKDQAVLVYLKLSDDDKGDGEIDDAIYQLQEKLTRLIEESGVGEFDGDEWGGGHCKLFMYGPDADRLFATITSELLSSTSLPLTHVVKRYGPPGAPESVVQWH